MIMALIILGMVVFPGVLVYFALNRPHLARQQITVGDVIVYRKQKISTHPGMRAYDIHAAGQGDFYTYLVDKYWVVDGILWDGQIEAVTRTNKRHYLAPDDPNLRKAGLVERLRYWQRLPHSGESRD